MIVVAVAVGVALASVLYLFNRRQPYGKGLTVTLFALRFLIGSLVTLLIFNPYVRQKISVVEPSTLVVAHDNSNSLILSKDSSYYTSEYLQDFSDFQTSLHKAFQVDDYLFGQEVREFDSLSYQDQLTDLSSLLLTIQRRYYKCNVGGVVVLTDGVYNRGYDPTLLAEKYPFPIHTVVLGDTLSYPDLLIKEVQANREVALDASFPVRVVVGANDCLGTHAVLTVSEDGRTLERRDIEVVSNRFSTEVDFMFDANQPGVRQLDIEISGLNEETQKLNNVRHIFIDVQDKKYKILCLADAPHPDLGALKSVLADNSEMDFIFGQDAIPNIGAYQLVIMHQVPSVHTDFEGLYSQLQQNKNTPVLVVVGEATSFDKLNKLQQAFSLHRGVTNTLLDVKAAANASFATFTISDALKDKVSTFPPLALPHTELNLLQPHDDLLSQEILGVKSGIPMLTFTGDERKVALLMGTNFWRWKLYEYYKDDRHEVFDELFSKTLKFMLSDANEGLKVFAKESFYSNEDVVISTELRNKSNELVTEPDVTIQIVNRKTNDKYEYVMSKREHDYFVNAGILPEGLYTYHAETQLGEQKLSANGSFSVVTMGIEAQQLRADIDGLRSLSAATNGKCYRVDQLPELLHDLNNDSRITSVEHHESHIEDLIHLKWIFFLVVGLAAIEWVLRKMFGKL